MESVFPIMPLERAFNRSQRRALTFELTKLNDPLYHLENQFIELLFDESDSRSYDELYTEYLDYFNNTVRGYKMKLTAYNKNYFPQQYKPNL